MPTDYMTPQSQREQEDSVFIRYASGFVLKIEPNVREVVNMVLGELQANNDCRTVLRSHIRMTSYGGGSDIAKESTWVAATLELFERFRRYPGSLSDSTRQSLVGLVGLLCVYESGVDWDRVRQYLIEHIDALCPLTDFTTMLEGRELLRDEQGYYYTNEDGNRVNVSGLMTPPEQALQYYTNDIQEPFGRLYHLLRYVALFEIAYQYKTRPSDFPSDLSCTLYDNNGGTHYLGWQWQRPVPFEYVAYKWYPRSPFSDPDWLGSDLIMHLELPSGHPDQPVLPFVPTDAAFAKWREVFGESPFQLELPVSTNLLIGKEPEVYLEFLDKKVRWINGNLFLEPMLIIPANDERGEEAIELARKFLSVINHNHDVEPSERFISIQPCTRYVPLIKQPRMTTFYVVDPAYALRGSLEQFTQQKWYALAFMREAKNARSIFYSFLNYYKIIEMIYGSTGGLNWINDNAERICRDKGVDWYSRYIAPVPDKKAGVQLAGTMRNAVAHGIYRNRGDVTHNPDDPQDYNATFRDLPAIRALAEVVVDSLT